MLNDALQMISIYQKGPVDSRRTRNNQTSNLKVIWRKKVDWNRVVSVVQGERIPKEKVQLNRQSVKTATKVYYAKKRIIFCKKIE